MELLQQFVAEYNHQCFGASEKPIAIAANVAMKILRLLSL